MVLLRLQYFYVVAKEGGFTKASKVLRIQQPALSKMVRQLEEHLSVPLLERHKKGVTLTHIGAEIFKKCEVLFEQVSEIEAIAAGEQSECHGPLSIGATDSVSSYLLPQLLRGFIEDHPRVDPSVFAGASNLVCSEIAEGRVEFGVFFTVPNGDFSVRDLVQVPFQLVGSKTVPPADSLERGFIMSREIDYPRYRPFPVMEMLRKNGLEARISVSCNNLDAQKHMVMEGLGVALLPSFMVRNEIQSGQLQALLPRKSFNYSLKVVTRKRKILSRNAAVFLEFLSTGLPGLPSFSMRK